MLRLPGAVVVDRPALELADVDVVEERLDLERDRPAVERDLGRLARPPEARVDAEVELEPGDLLAERARPRSAPAPSGGRDRGVAVDAPHEVQLRLAVADEDEESHGPSLRP